MPRLGGWDQHAAGVRRLQDSYASIPVEAPVRLAKKSSNLFRHRDPNATPGLDVSGLTGVIAVDPQAHTAEVQGMCTYEYLVDALLPFGEIPLVVPQLRTITLGGAVTGLGIESTSFRNGLPHESVLEMDVLTGVGEVVTTKPGDDLFEAFPNSYGSLGYATRLRIETEPVPSHVSLRHIAFTDTDALVATIEEVCATREHAGQRIDAMDGVAFAPGEYYLTLATWVSTSSTNGVSTSSTDGIGRPSDYTGQQVYYRSIQQRPTDLLTMHDYLWRWDTDWFWCSRAFGAQHPVVRRLWPRRWRRSDVYHRLVALDHRFGIGARLDRRAGRPQGERVVQDIEIPVARLGEFLDWFDATIGMRPVWLCPLRLRPGGHQWPTYPLHPGTTYVNIGFWGNVGVGPEAPRAPLNRAIEAKVSELGGHKSLYSEAFYDADTFAALYGVANLTEVKKAYDPDDRLTSLYDKAVRRR